MINIKSTERRCGTRDWTVESYLKLYLILTVYEERYNENVVDDSEVLEIDMVVDVLLVDELELV